MRTEKLAIGGAIAAAVTASLCCTAPIVFAMLGIGVFGASAFFEAASPYLIGSALALFGFGFYRYYTSSKMNCAPGEICETKSFGNLNLLGLLLAGVIVAAFAAFPYYSGWVYGSFNSVENTAVSNDLIAEQRTATFKIKGMTCAGCAISIKEELKKTPGVIKADVSYEQSEAVVVYDSKNTTPAKLREVIEKLGYEVIQ